MVLLDQRLLPGREVYRTYRDPRRLAQAIRAMVVRGAPAIGVTAAFGVALGMRQVRDDVERQFSRLCELFAATRPTAVNLFWAIERMKRRFAEVRGAQPAVIAEALLAEAQAIYEEDRQANRALGFLGAELLPHQANILTHCNAGALATAGYGTALGIVRAAGELGKQVHVYACETRPFLQGARLTAWELLRDRIPVTLITDNMAADVMRRGLVNCVIVGADRIAANGDVANKIGTYGLALLSRAHGLPFYVAAPFSTVDLRCPSGQHIVIETRSPDEVTHCGVRRVAPRGVRAENPAFDVTPARLVRAIVTERGVARMPYRSSLRQLAGQTTAKTPLRPGRTARKR